VDYACGGHADKAGVPYGIRSEIWSPPIGYVGVGSGDEVLLRFRVYADLDLQNLVFYVWHVRSLAAGHVGPWRDRGLVYYGDDRDWHDVTFPIGDLVEPDASAIQVALGVWDMRDVWYGVLGERDCHSQAPLFDDVEVLRLASQGPRWHARHFDLFQDVFATDSALTRTARADMAADITPRCGGIIPGIRPGDSVCVWVSDPAGLDFDPGGRLAAYAYVSLLPAGQSAKDGAQMQAAEMDGGQYRFPYLAPVDGHPGWHRFRMDQARDALDRLVPNRFCFDLKDDLFTAGDTVRYVLGARNRDAVESFWSRRLQGQGEDFVTNSLDEALASPCEFTVLPAGGWRHGGDILYVDHADDRNDSPADRIGDAFALLPYRDTTLAAAVDRYDVLGPSALVGNGPGSRLGAGQARLGDWYRRVVWDSGDLPAGTIGDGSGTPEKSDDFRLLYDFLEQTPDSVLVMVAGDDLNQEWAGLSGTWAARLRQDYAPWTLLSGNHWEAGATLPLTGVGGGFAGDVVTADAGCGGTARRDWDVFDPAPAAFDSVAYMYSGIGAAARRHIRLNGRSQRAWVVGMGLSLSDVVDTGDRAELLDRVLNQVPFLPVADVEPPRARADYLAQGYPNPARPSATIRFGLARRGPVSLKIYSVTGQLVRTLVNGMQEPAGDRALVWNGCDERGRPVASGVYFCRLVTQGMSRSHKLILLR
jgi:hypothetical protein